MNSLQKITNCTKNEFRVLNALQNLEFISKTLLLNMTSTYILNKLSQLGLIRNYGRYVIFGEKHEVYTNSSKSKEILREDYNKPAYKGNIRQLEHDYMLAKIYFGLTDSEKDSWKNETEINMKLGHGCDGIFKSDSGYLSGVEVITKRYNNSDIYKRAKFIRDTCDSYIIFDIRKMQYLSKEEIEAYF